MKYKVFSIPIQGDNDKEAVLNQFCSSHCIITIDKQLATDGQRNIWTFCVEYEAGNAISQTQPYKKKPVIDYKEILNDDDFACYAKLRDLRKEISQADNVPAYAIFTNEQLAEIVRKRIITVIELSKIDRVGEAKQEKYGERFVAICRDCFK